MSKPVIAAILFVVLVLAVLALLDDQADGAEISRRGMHGIQRPHGLPDRPGRQRGARAAGRNVECLCTDRFRHDGQHGMRALHSGQCPLAQ